MIRSPSSSSSHSDDNFRTIDNFDNLTLPTFLLNDLYEFNLKSPTNWQAQILPDIMNGYDVQIQANLNSDTIILYAIKAILTINQEPDIKPMDGPIVIILSPNKNHLLLISKYHQYFTKKKFKFFALIMPFFLNKMNKVCTTILPQIDLLIGFPQHVLRFIHGKQIKLNRLKMLVLDYANLLKDLTIQNLEQGLQQLKYQTIVLFQKPDENIVIKSKQLERITRRKRFERHDIDNSLITIGPCHFIYKVKSEFKQQKYYYLKKKKNFRLIEVFEQNFYNKLVIFEQQQKEIVIQNLQKFQQLYKFQDHNQGLLAIKEETKAVATIIFYNYPQMDEIIPTINNYYAQTPFLQVFMILTEVEIEIFPVIKNKLFELKVQIPLWLKKNDFCDLKQTLQEETEPFLNMKIENEINNKNLLIPQLIDSPDQRHQQGSSQQYVSSQQAQVIYRLQQQQQMQQISQQQQYSQFQQQYYQQAPMWNYYFPNFLAWQYMNQQYKQQQ